MDAVNDFLNTQQAADKLGMKPCTLEAWRVRGGGPRFRKFGKAVRYHRADLDRFAEERTYTSTSAVAA